VLNQSPLFIDVIRGHTPEVPFTINGCEYHMSTKQASVRKDVECAFGLLKKMFNILDIPGRSYSQRTLGLIIRACIILHNMIIDDERGGGYDDNYHTVTFVVAPPINYEAAVSLTSIRQREVHLTYGLIFLNFQSDLIEHV
jgi:hypothetical protein